MSFSGLNLTPNAYYRILPTNTSRSSLLMLHTMPSATTQGSTGSARVSTSTASFVVLPRLARSSGVSEEKVTCTTRTGHLAGQPGRGTRPSPSADIAELLLAAECLTTVHPSTGFVQTLNCQFCSLKLLCSELLIVSNGLLYCCHLFVNCTTLALPYRDIVVHKL